MPGRYEIQVLATTKEAEKNLDSTAKGLDKVADSAKKTDKALDDQSKTTDKLSGSKRKLLDGVKALGHEIPLLGAALAALKNPFTIIGTVGVAAFAALKKHLDEVKQSQEEWTSTADNVQVIVKPYKDAAEAAKLLADALADIAKFSASITTGLEDKIKNIETAIQGQIRLLEAMKGVEAATIERDEKDPAVKARKLKELDLKFGARIGGLQGSLPGQQAQLVEQQIAEEKRLQVEAGQSVPNAEALQKAVAAIEADRSGLRGALVTNRRDFQRAELLRMAVRAGAKGDPFKEFTPGQRKQLEDEGVLFQDVHQGIYQIDAAKAAALLPGAEAVSARSRGRVDTLRAGLRTGLAALPPGVATAADIPGFISTAEAEAARVQNDSYRRQQGLEARKGQLLEEQRTGGAERAFKQQAIAIQAGTTGAGDAFVQRRGDEILRLSQSTDAKDKATLDLLYKLLKNNENYVREIQRMQERLNSYNRGTTQDMR